MQEKYTVLDDSNYDLGTKIRVSAKIVKIRNYENFYKNATEALRLARKPVVKEEAKVEPKVEATKLPETPSVAEETKAEPVKENAVVVPTKEKVDSVCASHGVTIFTNVVGENIKAQAFRKLRVANQVKESCETATTYGVLQVIEKVETPKPSNSSEQSLNFFGNLSNLSSLDDTEKKEVEVPAITPLAESKINDERLNEYFSGNLSNEVDIEAYRRELEDLNDAKSNLAEMDNNVAECKKEIIDLTEVLAAQRRAKAREREEIAQELQSRTQEYKDLRAQIISMQELIEKNKNEEESYRKLA